MNKVSIFCLLFICLFAIANINAQQVAKPVVVEIGTYTTCSHCPSATLAADMLRNYEKNVIVIENFDNGSFSTAQSLARDNYYGIIGFPTAIFDGVANTEVTGGTTDTSSMYSSYLPEYQLRASVMSSFTLSMSYSNTGNSYNTSITTNKVASYSGTKLRLFCFIIESYIPFSWRENIDELSFVNRLMVPDTLGTKIDFTSQSSQTVNLSFTKNPSWVANNCEIVAILQDSATKEILQAHKIPMSVPLYNYDVAALKIMNPDTQYCGGIINPKLRFVNWGSDTLKTLTIKYSVNVGAIQTFNWTGNLPYLQRREVILPQISFTQLTKNTLTVILENPNGQADQNSTNDTLYFNFGKNINVATSKVLFRLRTGRYPNSDLWIQMYNSAGQLEYDRPLNYIVNAYTQYPDDTLNISDGDCYHFVVHDITNNGFQVGSGGWFKLLDLNGKSFYSYNTAIDGNSFIYTCNFSYGVNGINENHLINSNIDVFPNPSSNNFNIKYYNNTEEFVNISILDFTGRLLFTIVNTSLSEGEHDFMINGYSMKSGVYFYKVTTSEKSYYGKFIKD